MSASFAPHSALRVTILVFLLAVAPPTCAFQEPVQLYFEANSTEGLNPFWPDYYSTMAAALAENDEFNTFRWGNAKTKLAAENKAGFIFINNLPESKPSLTGSGLSYALTSLPPCSVDAIHLHPQSVEHMFTVKGVVMYSFVDTNGKYHQSTGCADSTSDDKCSLKNRDLCPKCKPNSYLDTVIVPQGLVQWQTNLGCSTAEFMSVFNSFTPGRINMASTFATGIPDFHVKAGYNLTGANFDRIKDDAKVGPFHYFPHSFLDLCRKNCGIDA